MSDHITPAELALWRAEGNAFDLLDVRRAGARAQHGADIAGARWHDPAAWLDWKDSIADDRPVVLYCVQGHEISQGLAATLRVRGVQARYLTGGIEGWQAAGQSVAQHPQTTPPDGRA